MTCSRLAALPLTEVDESPPPEPGMTPTVATRPTLSTLGGETSGGSPARGRP